MDYKYIPFYVQGNAVTGMYYGQWGMAEDRDIEYVKEMYPLTFMTIQEMVEKECDYQEFAGSMMFDEYPDKMGILRIVKILKKKRHPVMARNALSILMTSGLRI